LHHLIFLSYIYPNDLIKWLNYNVIKMTDNKVDTEKLILEAARKVFIRKGLDGARMQEIADEAGINKALLHYYFRSKDKLFKMVFREAMAKFFPSMLAILNSEALSIEKKFENFIEYYFTTIRNNPFIPGFVINELNKNPDQIIDFFEDSGIDILKVSSIVKNIVAKETGLSISQARHLVVNVIGLSLFPFLARPIIESAIFESQHDDFEVFLDERKAVIMEIVRNKIQKEK